MANRSIAGEQQNIFFLTPEQRHLLLSALSSNKPSPSLEKNSSNKGSILRNPAEHIPEPSADAMDASIHPAAFGLADDENPFLDFKVDGDFDFQDNLNDVPDFLESITGDGNSDESETPEASSELREKRKEMEDEDSDDDVEESGKKLKESDDKASRKPGRKLVTAQPTTVSNIFSLPWFNKLYLFWG